MGRVMLICEMEALRRKFCVEAGRPEPVCQISSCATFNMVTVWTASAGGGRRRVGTAVLLSRKVGTATIFRTMGR